MTYPCALAFMCVLIKQVPKSPANGRAHARAATTMSSSVPDINAMIDSSTLSSAIPACPANINMPNSPSTSEVSEVAVTGGKLGRAGTVVFKRADPTTGISDTSDGGVRTRPVVGFSLDVDEDNRLSERSLFSGDQLGIMTPKNAIVPGMSSN